VASEERFARTVLIVDLDGGVRQSSVGRRKLGDLIGPMDA
jgi:hypothetical protein